MAIKKSVTILLFCFVLIFTGCDKEPPDDLEFADIKLLTNKAVYNKTDTIRLSLENGSAFNIKVGLRCARWLETSYREEINGKWSDEKLLQYMYLRCLTAIDTVNPKTTTEYQLPANFFDGGKYKLSAGCYIAEKDTNIEITSNIFEIGK